jgi:catecholate siderophore receptor
LFETNRPPLSPAPASSAVKTAPIKSLSRPALGAAAVAGLAGLASMAHAQTGPVTNAAAVSTASAVSQVDVIGTQTREAVSPKFTSPIADTPQTITVVPAKLMQTQNLFSLRDVLSTVPGITFGAGEGGGGYGDSITLRGFSANADITLDGVRDSAQYSRTDNFNIEQVEVINGASSVYNGAGSVGGVINVVSKTPTLIDTTTVTAGVGTDKYGRVTVDANKALTDTIAVRLNVLAHRNDVPGRDVEQYKRWGFAPSIGFGLGTDTRFTLSWYHQEDDNTPQYGVPYYNGRPVPGVSRDTYFGYRNLDTQETNVDVFTGIFSHEFGNGLSVRNLARYQEVDQYAVVDPPQGSYCLSNGQQAAGWTQTAAATNVSGYVACTAGITAGFYQPSGPRGNLRDSRNTIAYNQTDLTWKGMTGGIGHTLVVGASFVSEDFKLGTGNVLRNPNGVAPNPVLPLMNIANPNNVWTGPVNYIQGSAQEGSRKSQAVYLFDTIELTPKFLISGGARYERNEGANRTDTYGTAPPTTGVITPGATFRVKNNLFSWRVGGVYKPQPQWSLYVSAGNSKTPSQTAVNGGCAADTCNVKPEEGRNYEAGVKWEARGGLLSLTGAVFRNERTNYRVPSGDPLLPIQLLDGSARVDGVALGASGKVTEKLQVFANYTYLKSKVLQGASDFVAGGGVTGTEQDFIRGDAIVQVPDHAFSVMATYDFTSRIQLGYSVTYQGETYLTQHAGLVTRAAVAATSTTPAVLALYNGRTTIPLVKSEAYSVHRLFATWRATDRLDVRVNVNNVFDKTYYSRIRNNGWATPSDGRFGSVTLSYRF